MPNVNDVRNGHGRQFPNWNMRARIRKTDEAVDE
jgi:hypothetical protein